LSIYNPCRVNSGTRPPDQPAESFLILRLPPPHGYGFASLQAGPCMRRRG
jgi:hypothetical protein